MHDIPIACLVIEDSDIDRALMERTLRRVRIPLRPLYARTLSEARAILRDETVGLILLDNSLPDGNGADFLPELAASRAWRDISVVLITGWPTPFMFAKARAARVLEVLDKDTLRGDVLDGLLHDKLDLARIRARMRRAAVTGRPVPGPLGATTALRA